ncbi:MULTISPECIES: hypothetical protein [Campylobacter]|uniref:hypothetical protein n=1 Tax=Campylobacter TaxID=194 RepID=UPI00301DC2ED|nr:hypothetical protein [Campylobacter sp. W0047]
MKKNNIICKIFLLGFLINLAFADIGSEAFVKSYTASCEVQSGNKDFCFCMANEVLNSLNDKERLLLNASSITPDISQDFQKLQMKIIQLSADEELLKYCLGE